MWWYFGYLDIFFIGFIDFMLQGKSLSDYANLFSSDEYEKDDKIILKYSQQIETKKLFYE